VITATTHRLVEAPHDPKRRADMSALPRARPPPNRLAVILPRDLPAPVAGAREPSSQLPQTASFVEKQDRQPARLLLVLSGRVGPRPETLAARAERKRRRPPGDNRVQAKGGSGVRR
jgi:hypothetical protein